MSLAALNIPLYPAAASNQTPGRPVPITDFTVHHMAGTPSTLRHLWADPTRNASSHYGVFPSYLEQYVRVGDTAWCNSNYPSNCRSITVEVWGDWRNGWTNAEALAQLKILMKAALSDMPHLNLTFHQDVSDVWTECPAQLRGHAQRVWNEAKEELAQPAPQPQILYQEITNKAVQLKWAANLWNFNFADWAKAQPVTGYPAGHTINVVSIATNALGGQYYMTEYSYNGGNIRATSGFNVKDCQDLQVVLPTPEPTPTPTPAQQDNGIKYVAYDTPIEVEVAADPTVLWDFSGKTWAEIAAKEIDKLHPPHKITVVGDATHPLGGIYLMTAYSFGDASKTGIPHKTWGVNAKDVIEVTQQPPTPPVTEQPPVIPTDPTPTEPAQGEGPSDAGAGDVLEPMAGETARGWLERLYMWILDQLEKFKYNGSK